MPNNNEPTNHLELWQKIEKVPEDVKILGDKMQDGTTLKTVASIERIKEATRHFGVYGMNWGLKDLNPEYHLAVHQKEFVVLQATFWVKTKELTINEPLIASTGLTRVVEVDRTNRTGKKYKEQVLVINDNFMKQLETRIINTALSRLGLFAELYKSGEDDEVSNEVKEDEKQEEELASLVIEPIKQEENNDE